jgi:hypothetical protein
MHESTATDAASLQMENELLVHEVRFVRAQLKAQERAHASRLGALDDSRQKLRDTQAKLLQSRGRVRALREELDEARRLLKAAGRRNKETRGQIERGRQAHADLTWLLQRLDGSVLGIGLRRAAGFRKLCDRYLRPARSKDAAA